MEYFEYKARTQAASRRRSEPTEGAASGTQSLAKRRPARLVRPASPLPFRILFKQLLPTERDYPWRLVARL